MRIPITLALLTLVTASQALAQSDESERRQACTGDAFKFCAGDIPDREKIRLCLTDNRDKLSPDCRTQIDGGRMRRRG